mgnify:CR=1 FL=1
MLFSIFCAPLVHIQVIFAQNKTDFPHVKNTANLPLSSRFMKEPYF